MSEIFNHITYFLFFFIYKFNLLSDGPSRGVLWLSLFYYFSRVNISDNAADQMHMT